MGLVYGDAHIPVKMVYWVDIYTKAPVLRTFRPDELIIRCDDVDPNPRSRGVHLPLTAGVE